MSKNNFEKFTKYTKKSRNKKVDKNQKRVTLNLSK